MRLRHKPTRPLPYSLSAPARAAVAHATTTVIDNANGYSRLARSQSMRGFHRRRPRPDLSYRPWSG